MMKIKIVICLCVVCGVVLAAAKPVRLTYVTLGSGVYGVLTDREGPYGFNRDSYFSTLKLEGYMQVYGWNVAVGVPLMVTFEVFEVRHLSRYAMHPADLSLQVGRRFRGISPRLVFKAPLGYPTSGDVAWIGSGNFRAGGGVGFNLGTLQQGRISFSGDMEVLTTINDTTGYSRMAVGSLSGYAVVKSTVMINSKLRTSLQAYSDFSTIRYTDWSILSERSITMAPIVSLQYRVGMQLTVKGWGGYGVKFNSLQQGVASNVVIAGLSMGYGF